MDRRLLKEIPCDRMMENEYGKEVCCHPTGYEVFLFEQWWVEYEDADGICYYGM